MDIRLLELRPDGCLFRLPLCFAEKEKEAVEFTFKFYLRDQAIGADRTLKSINADCKNGILETVSAAVVGDSTASEIGPGLVPVDIEKGTCDSVLVELNGDFSIAEKKRNDFWVEWDMATNDESFRVAALALTREYLDYIEARQTMDDAELAHYMTGSYPLDESICGSREEQLALFARKIMSGLDVTSWDWIYGTQSECLAEGGGEFCDHNSGTGKRQRQLSIALETRAAYDRYLSSSFEDFVEAYWVSAGLEAHPLARCFTGLSCDENDSDSQVDYAFNSLHVGNAFCPLQAPSLRVLMNILDKASEERLKVTLVLAPVSELKVEEMQDYLIRLHEQLNSQTANYSDFLTVEAGDYGIKSWIESQAFPRFKVVPGQLMNKEVRDSRSKYIEQSTCRNADAACENIYLPYQQMNTATFCTLYAAVNNGSRGKQERVKTCPGYCEERAFLYPKNLDMIGRFNSLFYADLSLLQKGDRVKESMAAGKTIILNFDF